MKTAIKKLSLLALLTLFLSGCYTQIQVTERPDRPVQHRSYEYHYSDGAYSDYDLGYFDGLSDGLFFRDYNRMMWSARMGYIYRPSLYYSSFHHRGFGIGSHFGYGYVHGFGFWNHYPMFWHYDFLFHPFHNHWYGLHFHYHTFPGFFTHHPSFWYGFHGRPVIIYNNFYAQAKPRPQTVRGSGIHRNTGPNSLAGHRNDLTRTTSHTPDSRMIPAVTRVQGAPAVSRGSSATISRQPASRGGQQGTINRNPPPRDRGSVNSDRDRAPVQSGVQNRPPAQQSSGTVNRPRTTNNNAPEARSRNNNSSNNNANRPRNRD